MSEFFEPPPPLEEPERVERQPPWRHAPSGTLPGAVALELVLARTEQVVVCVTRLGAYSAGFELELVTMTSGESDDLDPFLFRGRSRGELQTGAGIPQQMLRFGVEFADGTKATNTSWRWGPREDPPPGPVLSPGGGGGSGGPGGNWRQSMWVWPLPPAGELAFVCEWPAAAIPLTRHEIDAQIILDAARRAQQFFTDEELANTPAQNISVSIVTRKPE